MRTTLSVASVFLSSLVGLGVLAGEVEDAMAFRKAIRANDIEAIRGLLDGGANPNGAGWQKGKQSPIETVVAFDELSEMRGLGYLPTPFIYAVLCDRVEIAKLLIEKGANVHTIIPEKRRHANVSTNPGDTAVNIAVKRSNAGMLSLLLKSGAKPNLNALCSAFTSARNVNVQKRGMAKTLMDAGAPINGVDRLGRTPLACAVRNWRLDLVKLLLEKGADIDGACRPSSPYAGNTPLLAAMNHTDGKLLEIGKFLLEKGANVNAKDDNGVTPLHKVMVRTEIVQLLLEKGADVNAKDKWGRTPLHCMQPRYSRAKAEAVRLVLEKGAQVNPVDEQGRTPLHYAAEAYSPEIVELLTKNGAKLNVADAKGRTPLHLVMVSKRPRGWNYDQVIAFTETLIQKGANVNAEDQWGKTPLDLAKFPQMRACLEKHGGRNGTPREPVRKPPSTKIAKKTPKKAESPETAKREPSQPSPPPAIKKRPIRVFTLEDGRQIDAVMVMESKHSYALKDKDGKFHQVNKKDVRSIKASE